MIKKNDWWKETFNETYFSFWDPSSQKSQDWTKKELKIIDDLHFKKNAKILDIPCGQGRHSIELAQKGFQVTGVDYSSNALQTAKKLARQNDLSVNFIKQDMRFLKLKEKFDAILNLGNSFGYFSDIDNENIIKNVSKLLKTDGFFIMHQINPIETLRQFGKGDKFKIFNGHVKCEDISFDPLNSIKKSRWIIIRGNKKEILNVKLRLYNFPEISYLFARYKLNIIKTYGSFDKKPYQFDSPSMIIIAKKYNKSIGNRNFYF